MCRSGIYIGLADSTGVETAINILLQRFYKKVGVIINMSGCCLQKHQNQNIPLHGWNPVRIFLKYISVHGLQLSILPIYCAECPTSHRTTLAMTTYDTNTL